MEILSCINQFVSCFNQNKGSGAALYCHCILLIALSALSKENLATACLFVLNLSVIFSYIIEDLKKNMQIYKKTFAAFFCVYLGNLYWVYTPLTFDINQYFWLMPFSVVFMPIYLACYSLVPAFFISRLCWHKIISNKFVLSVICSGIFVFCEIIASYAFTGFTWHIIGYCWIGSIIPLQITSAISIYGLSFFTYLITVLLALYIGTKKRNVLYIAVCIFSFILLFGLVRINTLDQEYNKRSIKVKIVQGNIWQSDKENTDLAVKNLEKYIKISQERCDHVDLEIWPEVTFPWVYLDKDSRYVRDILSPVLKNCDNFIFGAIRKDNDGNYYNSAIIFSNDHVEYYDKQHLLPFGEYIPAKEYIKFSSIANQLGSFTKGNSKNIFVINGCKILLQICYEAIFPPVNYRNADFVVNITNDGWFKNSQEAKHHHLISRAMAIEYGIPYIRVNNYGFSGCFDKYGKEIAAININCATSVILNIF